MKRMTHSLILLALVLATPLAVCAEPVLQVFVSVLPQQYFVERIGGDRVKVEVLVGPGQSPATLDPTPKQMARLTGADLYLRIGVPFENVLMDRLTAANEKLRVVDQREGLDLLVLEEGHHHDDGHGHEAGELDPHIWLSPKLAMVQAQTIARALAYEGASAKLVYHANFSEFIRDLKAVDARIEAALAGLENREFFVFHPAYGYFAQAYGLTQVAVEFEGKEPSGRQLARLIDRAKAAGVKVLFVQPQFSDKSARAVADGVGAAVVKMDPLAPDYLENLERMAQTLADALGPGD
jgi:zinc transport system substrate-binding protein